MSNEDSERVTRGEVVRPLLIAVPTWLIATVFFGPLGFIVAMTGAIAGPHRPLLKAMRQSENRFVAIATPGLHLCLMTFPWLLPWLRLDVSFYLRGEAGFGVFLPYAIVTFLTVFAALGVSMLDDGRRLSGREVRPIAQEALVLATYAGVQLFALVVNDSMIRGAIAEHGGDGDMFGYELCAFNSIPYYVLLLGLRAYVNRPARPR